MCKLSFPQAVHLPSIVMNLLVWLLKKLKRIKHHGYPRGITKFPMQTRLLASNLAVSFSLAEEIENFAEGIPEFLDAAARLLLLTALI